MNNNTQEPLFPSSPVCLVKQNGKNLELCEEGLELLRSYDNHPIAAVTVAGMYRTGKSFFLNQLAGTSGFKVGSSVQSCTRGIWMWPVPASRWKDPNNPSARLMLLDTEGLASMDNDENYDARIFSLGILLSSYFVYNSMGVIDESAIDRLFLVGELTKNICISTSVDAQGNPATDDTDAKSGISATNPDELANFFPPFMWLLRDFSLALERDGRPITERDYLEQALEDRPGTSARVQDHNQIRHSFKTLFPDRDCATMVRPVHEETQLRKLTSVKRDQFRPEFLEQLDRVTNTVLSRVAPKVLFNRLVTGRMLGSLAQSYVEAINGGAVPDIKKGYEYMVEDSFRVGFAEASQYYNAKIQAVVESIPLASRADFDDIQATIRKEAVAFFDQKTSVGGGGIGSVGTTAQRVHWVEQLEDEIEKLRTNALASLERRSFEECTSILTKNLETLVKTPLDAGEFDEDPSLFMNAMLQCLQSYNEASSGPAKETVIAQLLTKEWFNHQHTLLQQVVRFHQQKTKEQADGWLSEQEHRKRLEVSLEGKESLLEIVQADLSQTKQELNRSNEECNTLNGQLREAQHKCAEVSQALAVSEQNLVDTQNRLKEIQQSSADKIEKLEQKLTRYRQKHEKVVEKYETLKETMHLVERTLDGAQRDLEESKRECDHQREVHEQEKVRLQCSIDELHSNVSELKSQLQTEQNIVITRDKEIVQLQADSQIETQRHNSEIQLKAQQLEKIEGLLVVEQETVKSLEQQLDFVKDELAQTSSVATNTKQQLDDSLATENRLQQEIQSTGKELSQLQEMCVQLRDANAALESKLESASTKFEQTKLELNQLGELRMEEEEKYGNVIAQLEESMAQMELSMESQTHKLTEKCEELEESTSNVRRLQETLDRERTLWEDHKRDLESGSDTLQVQIDAVRSSLVSEQNKVAENIHQLELEKEHVVKLKADLETERLKRQKLETLGGELEEILSEKESMLLQLSKRVEESEKDSVRYKRLQSENNSLYENIEVLSSERHELELKLRNMQMKHDQVVAELQESLGVDVQVKEVVQAMVTRVRDLVVLERVAELEKRLATISEEKAEVTARLQLFMTQAAQLPEALQERLFNPLDEGEPVYLW